MQTFGSWMILRTSLRNASGVILARRLWLLVKPSHTAVHQKYRCDNHRGRGHHVEGDMLVCQPPAEKHGHDGIYVGVGRHQRRRIVFEQPVVSRECDDRSEQYQIT